MPLTLLLIACPDPVVNLTVLLSKNFVSLKRQTSLQGARLLSLRSCATCIVSSPVKETLLLENFWLQVEPDTWRVGDLPMRHGAALHCNSATIRR